MICPTRRIVLAGLVWISAGIAATASAQVIAPSVYTTFEELDRFAEVMETIAQRGLPA